MAFPGARVADEENVLALVDVFTTRQLGDEHLVHKTDVLLDPDTPALGHVTRQRQRDQDEWVRSAIQTHEPLVDEITWQQVQALIAANTRSRASAERRGGSRRSEPSRYLLAGLVTCDACGKKLQGNMVREQYFYRCKVSSDYPAINNGHPRSLAIREERLLPHIDSWFAELFTPERVRETAAAIVAADAANHREDPAVERARRALADCERRLAKHLDGLEAGIPPDVIAPRIAAAQREKAAAEEVLALAPPAPQPLSLDEVLETLTVLRSVPDLLGKADPLDRAMLYRSLGLAIRYRRLEDLEEVRLELKLQPVDLEQVGVWAGPENSLVSGLRGVDLERVGGGT